MESQHTATSKISILSSHSSARSNVSSLITDQSDKGNDHQQREIKLEKAKMDLMIDGLESEKLYYQAICRSIQEIVEMRREEGPSELVQCLIDILTVDPEP